MGHEEKNSGDPGTGEPPENNAGRKQSDVHFGDIGGLRDYYTHKKLTADRFLRELRKRKIDRFRAEDVDQAMAQLDELDREFAKTLDLIYRATAKRYPLTNDCVSYVADAIRQQLSRHYSMELDHDVSAKELFSLAAAGLEKAVTSKRPDVRAFNLIRAIGIWLSASRNLDVFDEVDVLCSHFHPGKPDHTASRASMEILFRPAAKVKATKDMLILASLGATKAKEANDTAARERQTYLREHDRTEQLTRELQEKEALLGQKDVTISELHAQVSVLGEQIESLKKKIDNDSAVSKHDRSELMGRARVFLDRSILPLLATAREFAELDPPRKATIIEKLEIAAEKISKEIEWLRSSD